MSTLVRDSFLQEENTDIELAQSAPMARGIVVSDWRTAGWSDADEAICLGLSRDPMEFLRQFTQQDGE